MDTDGIDELIEEAHATFNATSIYEIIDMPPDESKEEFLNDTYNTPRPEVIRRYLAVVDRIKQIISH